MRNKRNRSVLFAAVSAAFAGSRLALGGAFVSPTDLLLLQTNGTSGGSNLSADSVTLNEYNPADGFSTAVNTINLPTDTLSYDGTNGLGLTLPDSSDHDGQLTLSQDGHQLVFATYLCALGPVDYMGTDEGPNDVPASQVPRVITVLHPDGTLDDSTQLSGADDYNSVSIRQVSSLDGNEFWSVGNGAKPYGSPTTPDLGGLRYSTLGATSTTSLNDGNGIDARSTAIFDGQLYVSGGSNNNPTGEHTVSQIGSGITSSGAPGWTQLRSNGGNNPDGTMFGTQSPQFVTLNSGNIVLYKADSTNGALEKYTAVNGSWQYDGAVVFGKDLDEDVAARVTGSSVELFFDNTGALYSFTDTGGAGNLTITGLTPTSMNPNVYSGSSAMPVLLNANDDLRGISFAPSTSAAVGNQIWGNPSGGTWSTASNWLDGVPDASGATATFGPNSPGLAANGIVTLAANETVGHVVFNNTAANYTIAADAGDSLTIDNTDPNASGVPSIYDEGGNHTISAPINLVAGVTMSAAYQSTLTISGAIGGSGGVSIYGLGQPGTGISQSALGVVTFSAVNNYSGTTTVNSGTLVIATAGALPSGGAVVNNGLLQINANTKSGNISGTGTVTVGSGSATTLQLANGSGGSSVGSMVISAGSTLDITNNHLIIDYGSGADPKSTILGYLSTGANGGAWNGVGINSSTANALPGQNYGVSFSDGADGINPALSSGQIEVSYAQYGDITQQGLVNAADFHILATNFGQVTTNGWEAGDFLYQGVVNAEDFHLLAENFGQTASGEDVSIPASDWAALDAFETANGIAPTNVPEPACVGLIAITSTSLLARRRRRLL